MLTPVPMLIKNVEYNAQLCYWNGAVTTRKFAMLIQSSEWNNFLLTESMRMSAWKEHVRFRSQGLFDDVLSQFQFAKDVNHSNYVNVLKRTIKQDDEEFFIKLKGHYSPKESLAWFFSTNELSV